MALLIALCVVAGVGLVIAGLQQEQQNAPETVAAKIARREQAQAGGRSAADAEVLREFVKLEEKRALAARRNTTTLPSLSSIITASPLLARLERDLMQVRSQWRASELLACSVFIGLLVFIILSLTRMYWWLALIGGVACLFIPWSYVRSKRAWYYRKFDEQLADTLMLQANGLKAGFSFLQSLEMVAREAPFPVADEFQLVSQQIAVGVPINDALNNLAMRVHSMDLNLMVTAVVIQREVGGGLAEILETISGVIRERLRIKGEIRVLTTQGRATGGILAFLPIGLGLALHFISLASSSDHVSFVQPLFTTSVGHYMLGAAIVLQIIGFIAIMRIVDIKV